MFVELGEGRRGGERWEGSIRFGCDHGHVLRFVFLLDADSVPRCFASCVEVVFRKSQLFL